jgi:hypothetical protein
VDEITKALADAKTHLSEAQAASPGPNRTAIEAAIRSLRDTQRAVEELAKVVRQLIDGDFS